MYRTKHEKSKINHMTNTMTSSKYNKTTTAKCVGFYIRRKAGYI